MSKLIKWPQRKKLNSLLDLYGYIAYLAAITFIITANFLSGTVRIILAISTNFIFLVVLIFARYSDNDKQDKDSKELNERRFH